MVLCQLGFSRGLGKGMECGIGKDLRELNERYTKTRLESAWAELIAFLNLNEIFVVLH